MELPVNSLVQLEIGFRLDINQLTFPCMMRRTVRETLDVSVAAPTCFSNVVAIMLLLLLLLFLFIFLLIFRFLLCQITHENVWKMRFLFRAKVSNWRQSFFCIF